MAKAVVRCPVEEAIRIAGGKWKLLVLRSLLLKPAGTGRLVVQDSRRYDLTKLGNGLMPTFKTLLTWGTKLPTHTPVR